MAKNGKKIDNEGLVESQIFERIKEELNPIQENLVEKKITIDEARTELKRINEWIQWIELEQKDKKEVWKIFENLVKLEQIVDENVLRDEVNEVIKLLENLTRKDLASLQQTVQQMNFQWNFERPVVVQQWIDMASNDLETTIHGASQDRNPIARKMGERMERLMA